MKKTFSKLFFGRENRPFHNLLFAFEVRVDNPTGMQRIIVIN